MRLMVLASAVLVGCMSLVLGMTGTLYAHTRQTSPCFAGNPDVSSSASSPPSTSGALFINEVLPVPHSHWNCANLSQTSYGNDAWIEFYNASNQALDLYNNSDIFISNAEDQRYPFPPGAGIAPHGFYVLFPNFEGPPPELRLWVNGIVVDSVSLPGTMPPDQSYARIPDGGPNWQIATTPTIGSSNVVAAQTASTPTPTAKSTSKKASSSKKTGSTRSSSGRSSAGTGQNSPNDPSQTGQDARQPSWKAMQLPGTPTQAAVSASRQQRGSPLPGVILLAASSLGLILALAWCWKLFKPKKRKSS